ncbi:alcohol dehydrogenase catalytic domain-containing protein [Streptomyces sp. NPDC001848]|uniref:alcohol dehydrogenase catalytic domain-containing protein n=1 Tax=Streptomyces sp. NPDC001848 TaxID=3364618 RepID=UPI00368CA444
MIAAVTRVVHLIKDEPISEGLQEDRGAQPPYVAGFEAAGEIVGVGPDIECPLPLGTHVVGTGPGAFAQYMTMPAAGVLPVPSAGATPNL